MFLLSRSTRFVLATIFFLKFLLVCCFSALRSFLYRRKVTVENSEVFVVLQVMTWKRHKRKEEFFWKMRHLSSSPIHLRVLWKLKLLWNSSSQTFVILCTINCFIKELGTKVRETKNPHTHTEDIYIWYKHSFIFNICSQMQGDQGIRKNTERLVANMPEGGRGITHGFVDFGSVHLEEKISSEIGLISVAVKVAGPWALYEPQFCRHDAKIDRDRSLLFRPVCPHTNLSSYKLTTGSNF